MFCAVMGLRMGPQALMRSAWAENARGTMPSPSRGRSEAIGYSRIAITVCRTVSERSA
ncbi:hypothetical protein BVI434_1980001 [Burkholderia vietnamiensis]|nr:hypothetical protein BVI434_1980001 [Burkholderia vietnamiensis]